MLWEVEIRPGDGEVDREGRRVLAEARALGAATIREVAAARSFLIEGELDQSAAEGAVAHLLADRVVEHCTVRKLPASDGNGGGQLLNVLFKPGVTDNVGETATRALRELGLKVERVATGRKYRVNADADEADVGRLSSKVLANDAIEHVLRGPLQLDSLALGSEYRFQLTRVPLREMDDAALMRLSKEGQLYLSLAEMQTVQRHFRELGREPTDIELETVAQTWSEHCSHKTLAGRIRYREVAAGNERVAGTLGVPSESSASDRTPEDSDSRSESPTYREIQFENMLKETVFAATQTIRQRLGADDWCVSVFRDNAGIVRFNETYDVCIKVETHNHPSAIEPYGGANTGLGGVIRDPLGTGMGAKPVCNTDVFCFAPPDTPHDELPPGVLHPKAVMKGVVAGVRDYGNRMGIPTVNGAVYFDERYLGNPLVYCGNVALIPRGKSEKRVVPGDYIVAVGGRTGRDGIHGATFSSAELTHESESISGGAVQIGNAITEKMLLDVILAARDRELYHAITDCGAGGFSSAVGEMGEETGAEVWLDKCPLKYAGLSYTEIWISEAQERMVLAVPPEHWDEFRELCASEGVEATVIGQFTDTQRLVLKYGDAQVGELTMEFLHDGRPPVVREAVWSALRRDDPNRFERDPAFGPDQWREAEDMARSLGISVEDAAIRLGCSADSQRAAAFGFQYIDLDEISIPADVYSRIPEHVAREHTIIPVALEEGRISIACADPLDFEPMEKVRFIVNLDVEMLMASPASIRRAIDRHYSGFRIEGRTHLGLDISELRKGAHGRTLKKILSSLNVCSKEWIIRQYDHEVQAGSVVKPLVGVLSDGPSDAAVVRPDLASQRGLVIACGMNPHYGDFDPYWMAASAIDEAVRNCVAVGADPSRIAILDNFCWGNTEKPEQLGSLVRAALGCHDTAVAYGTPFVSGKDSLNNEFTYVEGTGFSDQGAGGRQRTIAIPPSLLITALGQIEDVSQAVTMDLKEPGNVLFLAGRLLGGRFGGSHYNLVHGIEGGHVPAVDGQHAPLVFKAVHGAMRRGCVRSCHDLSEGGLAVALAEMAFAGGLGAEISLAIFEHLDEQMLFIEANTCFVLEVPPEREREFLEAVPFAARLGVVSNGDRLLIRGSSDRLLIDETLPDLKSAWQSPLRWE